MATELLSMLATLRPPALPAAATRQCQWAMLAAHRSSENSAHGEEGWCLDYWCMIIYYTPVLQRLGQVQWIEVSDGWGLLLARFFPAFSHFVVSSQRVQVAGNAAFDVSRIC